MLDRNSVASMLMEPPVSIAIGTKWCVLLRQEYLFILFTAALVAPAPPHSAVSTLWEVAYVSVMVTSQWSGLPCTHGISVALSGRFLSIRDRPIGSLVAGIWAFFTAYRWRSFNCEWRMCLGELFLQERSWSPLASTAVPQMHVWGWHVVDPNRYLTATRTASSDRRRQATVIEAAMSQSPACVTATALNLALSTDVSQLICRSLYIFLTTGVSQGFWMCPVVSLSWPSGVEVFHTLLFLFTYFYLFIYFYYYYLFFAP